MTLHGRSGISAASFRAIVASLVKLPASAYVMASVNGARRAEATTAQVVVEVDDVDGPSVQNNMAAQLADRDGLLQAAQAVETQVTGADADAVLLQSSSGTTSSVTDGSSKSSSAGATAGIVIGCLAAVVLVAVIVVAARRATTHRRIHRTFGELAPFAMDTGSPVPVFQNAVYDDTFLEGSSEA